MTAPDPLREDEVEAIARVIEPSVWNVRDLMGEKRLDQFMYATYQMSLQTARAAILRLDEVRGRGK